MSFLFRPAARLAALLRHEDGATAVEFALTAPLFVSMLLGILQIAIVWEAKTSLQQATQDAGRLVLTKQASMGGYTQAQFKTALCGKITAFLDCNGVMINLQQAASLSAVSTASPTLTYNASGNVTNTFAFNTGSANSIMTLQALYQFPVVAGPLFGWSTQSNGTLLLVATYVFKNEP
jgi:Flp pilus assembly protein TadG